MSYKTGKLSLRKWDDIFRGMKRGNYFEFNLLKCPHRALNDDDMLAAYSGKTADPRCESSSSSMVKPLQLTWREKKKQGSATRKHNLHQPRLCRATHFSEEEEILVVEIKCSCVITGQRGFHWCSLKRWETAHCQTDKIKALKAAELNGKESVGVWYRA